MKEFLIRENDAGQRLDKFLSKAARALPQGMLYKGIRLKRIKVNGKRCQPNQMLQPGDRITLYLNDEFFPGETPRYEFLTAPASLVPLYEDENLLLLNKPCGLVVHEDNENTADTLIHRVQHYLYDRGEYRPDEELSFAPALCNRIDRNTSGIVIVAKNAATLRIMNQKIKDRELTKKYLCVVHGILPQKEAMLTAYLKKDESENRVAVVSRPQEGYKTIRTAYTVLAEKEDLSLLEVNLLTGRTHQIRAHLAFLGYPILGDGKYGINREDKKRGYKYQALCAYQLTFSFRTDAGILSYLDGKTFTVPDVWFRKEFERNN